MNDTVNINTIRSDKFDSLTIVENGIVLVNKKKENASILFSEIAQIHIKKNKFSSLNKMGGITILFILLSISILYFPMEIVMSASILYIPLIVKMNKYKWYQLNVILNDGTSFKKVFFSITKQEYINLVYTVRKEIFDNRIKFNIQNKKNIESNAIEDDYSIQGFSVV